MQFIAEEDVSELLYTLDRLIPISKDLIERIEAARCSDPMIPNFGLILLDWVGFFAGTDTFSLQLKYSNELDYSYDSSPSKVYETPDPQQPLETMIDYASHLYISRLVLESLQELARRNQSGDAVNRCDLGTLDSSKRSTDVWHYLGSASPLLSSNHYPL
ncbi:hypothetical protein Ciccas_011804 [Cichlidogyrus casuarinus]|uniref:Uncharacterized protein n=1 Tax=Cichlidogyrus casuarinus TaxID=1844966 RepID=A0ABD2PQP3_9PLAT